MCLSQKGFICIYHKIQFCQLNCHWISTLICEQIHQNQSALLTSAIQFNIILSNRVMAFKKIWCTVLPPHTSKKPTYHIDFLSFNLPLFKVQLFFKMCLKRTLLFSKFVVAIRALYILEWKVRTDSKLVSIGKNPWASMELRLFTSNAFLAFWEQDFIVFIIIIILKATKAATFMQFVSWNLSL